MLSRIQISMSRLKAAFIVVLPVIWSAVPLQSACYGQPVIELSDEP
jgi:hypothetical protein